MLSSQPSQMTYPLAEDAWTTVYSEIVACPVCNGKLYFNKENQELVCKADGLAYPLRDGIPVLLENEARALSLDEKHA